MNHGLDPELFITNALLLFPNLLQHSILSPPSFPPSREWNQPGPKHLYGISIGWLFEGRVLGEPQWLAWWGWRCD